MADIELTKPSVPKPPVPSSDEYIAVLNQKFGAHTNETLVESLKRNYDKILDADKIKLIESLRKLDDIEEGVAKIPYISGGKSRRKRHKRKMRRNKTKRKR
jgi:hypothetical protein